MMIFFLPTTSESFPKLTRRPAPITSETAIMKYVVT